MTIHPNGNGNQPSFEQSLAEHAAGLRDLLSVERAEVERLKAELDEARTREQRVQKAIDVLLGTTSQQRSAQTKRASSSPSQHGWQVSEERIALVWAAMRGRTEPTTVTQLAKSVDGVSPETARKAIGKLRERELVRVSGTARGGGALLLPMPGTDDVESAAAHG